MDVRPQLVLGEVTIDCRDPAREAEFWSALLDLRAVTDSNGWLHLVPAVPGGPVINFQPVPEDKVGKGRVHLDVWVDDFEAGIARAEQLGARRLGEVQEPEGGRVLIMADPEGHEFCLVALPAAPDSPS
ncbi:MAG: VOC family protein [Actinomycetota bacterium]